MYRVLLSLLTMFFINYNMEEFAWRRIQRSWIFFFIPFQWNFLQYFSADHRTRRATSWYRHRSDMVSSGESGKVSIEILHMTARRISNSETFDILKTWKFRQTTGVSRFSDGYRKKDTRLKISDLNSDRILIQP